ncbi:hypothetical protein V1478_008150 [Vespula squamosa]|uniref:Uncharacterized protein n=1 Tax=Vespula squamosa TaxID=30214 RepID=A0ABD2AY03_VESSQ
MYHNVNDICDTYDGIISKRGYEIMYKTDKQDRQNASSIRLIGLIQQHLQKNDYGNSDRHYLFASFPNDNYLQNNYNRSIDL